MSRPAILRCSLYRLRSAPHLAAEPLAMHRGRGGWRIAGGLTRCNPVRRGAALIPVEYIPGGHDLNPECCYFLDLLWRNNGKCGGFAGRIRRNNPIQY